MILLPEIRLIAYLLKCYKMVDILKHTYQQKNMGIWMIISHPHEVHSDAGGYESVESN